MVNLDFVLFVIAIVLLLLAAFPNVAPKVQWQWLAGAVLVLTRIV